MTGRGDRDGGRAAVRDPGWPAVIVTDAAGRVTHWSDAAEAIYGWPAGEALGRDVATLTVDAAETTAAAEVLAAVAEGRSWEGVFTVRDRSGATFRAHVRDTPVHDADGRLVAIVGLSYPVGEARFPLLAAERAARASSERSAERLRRLQQLTAELSRAMSIDEVAALVLARGLEIESAGSGALWLLDEAAGVLRFQGATGMVPGMAARFASLPLDAPLPGPATVRTGEPIYLASRADRDTRWPALTGTPSTMEAQAIVPLVVDDRPIGCLSFGFPEVREFGAGERDFLAALGNVCAQVLDRARLHDAERAATRRVEFLAEAARVLAGSLDYEVTLQRLVALLLDAFAALVVIDVVGPDGLLQRAAAGHVDESKRELLGTLRNARVRPGTHSHAVLSSGEPRLVAEVTDADVRAASGDEETYRAALAMALGPAMVVPMTAGGRVVGLLTLSRERGATPFTPDDLTLAVDLGARAGSAVENARLFAASSSVAETLQHTLLPPRLPDVPGLELGARYRPALAGLEVGGDFYDCYAVGDGWAFMLGDVVGSGPKAAAVTALVRHTARAVAPYVDGPGAVVRAIRDAIVAGDDDEVFCTLLYGAIARDAGGVRLSVVGAGHPPPFVLRAGGGVERVDTRGSLLGVLPPVGIEPVDVLLAPGDTLVGVTDGVLEARPAPTVEAPERSVDFFDEDRLRDVLVAAAGGSADAVAGAVEAAVLEFSGGRVPDDVAVLVLRAT
ncbi:MAG TPA: SpoIIE family protein phosphatase [Mycobacteriales bacterium]|nr:SpoIIE family protein phosphatase [Mycobacteriales bacterium]